MNSLQKIVSGGQTGADRAGLDFAVEQGIPHGGWCPRGRLAEDGPLHERYQLQETSTANYIQRTERNVVDSDGTVILTLADKLTGGSRRTAGFAKKHGKPWLHLSWEGHPLDPAADLRWFLQEHGVSVLNVAGPRGSKEPGVAAFVRAVLVGTITR